MRAQLAAALNVGFACPAAVLDKFTKYYRLAGLQQADQSYDADLPQDFIYKHIWDSLFGQFLRNAVFFGGRGNRSRVPGGAAQAGFLPHVSLTSVEAAGKKVAFLHRCCAELSIEAEILHARAERLGQVCPARTIRLCHHWGRGSYADSGEYCLPLVRPGELLAMQGPSVDARGQTGAKAMKFWAAGWRHVRHYELLNGDGRSLVIVEEGEPYPRALSAPPGSRQAPPLTWPPDFYCRKFPPRQRIHL